MAETNSLLNCRIPQGVPGVRIPPSPQQGKTMSGRLFFRGMAQLASAPALGAGGRRFKSFCPDGGNQGVTETWLLVFYEITLKTPFHTS